MSEPHAATTAAAEKAWREWRDATSSKFPEPGRGEAFYAGWVAALRAVVPEPRIEVERLREALRRSVEQPGMCWDCGRLRGHMDDCGIAALIPDDAGHDHGTEAAP